MLTDTNIDDLLRITTMLNSTGSLSTGFEFNGFVFHIERKDFYLEQHYKALPCKDK